MTDRLTMADIGRLAGVSASTVSRALSDSPAIPTSTKQRILDIAAAHNYQVNVQAQNLRLQSSKTIATVFPYSGESHRLISDPFYLEIIAAITNELANYQYDMIISRVATFDDAWCRQYILQKRVDGIIFVDRALNDHGIQTLQKMGASFIAWGVPLPDQDYLSVGCDSFEGGRRAVQHVVGLGRRRIAFVGGHKEMVETAARHEGYRAGLAEFGLAYQEPLVQFTDFTQQAADRAVKAILEADPAVDAIFLCSDFTAIAAMEALRASGRSVPTDVSVIGYDDINLANYSSPRLTTIRQDLSLGARLLVEKLFAHMNGIETTSAMLPIDLIIRDSCGASLLR